MKPIVVMKFGGSSVASAEGWHTIRDRIAAVREEGSTPLVVCSALSGVSDLLEKAVELAVTDAHGPLLEAICLKHEELTAELGVASEPWRPVFEHLAQVLSGVSLIGEVSDAVRARVMSAGELMSTRLGAAWLGASVTWLDARELLRSAQGTGPRHFLEASVEGGFDEALTRRIAGLDAALTQGFIGRDGTGRTVVLGRGGSDTAAALLAAKVGAARCEIWSDVPGIFSTNPREVPGARLLTHLSYEVAEEVAAMGAKVLHPRALAPVRAAKIPMLLRWTARPEAAGTRIDDQAPDKGPQVVAIAARRGVRLVSVESIGMWHEVGYLAKLFTAISSLGFSIDLLSSGQSTVTVSLDDTPEAREPQRLAALQEALSPFGTARIFGPCVSVSLVGQHIRGMLHRVGPALEVFEDHPVHLVSQSASDRNLTFVVDEDEAPRLIKRLHEQLIGKEGPSWQDLHGGVAPRAAWWQDRVDELLAVGEQGTPAYVYDLSVVAARAAALQRVGSVSRWFYAIKANAHPQILRTLHAMGVGFECVSPGELARVFEVCPTLDPKQVLYTPNFAPQGDYEEGFRRGVNVTVDNLGALVQWPETFANRDVLLRIDPGEGKGHHAHVRTGGLRSKFGIIASELEEAVSLVERGGGKVVGLHAHAGSGILDGAHWAKVLTMMGELAARVPTVRSVDIGGGLGVPVRPEDQPLDLQLLDERLSSVLPEGLEVWMEPGRYLVAEAGVLLAKVTQRKTKAHREFVGTDAGMHTLLRPALYGAWHEIRNLSRLTEPSAIVADVVGPICESGDTLGYSRKLPQTEVGDLLLVSLGGAYGASMSSNYNLRGLPAEVVLPLSGPEDG